MADEQEGEVTSSEAEPEKDKPTLEELQKQITNLQENSGRFEENWKNEQRVSSKKEVDNQRLREQLSSNESQSDMNKVLIAMMANQRNQPVEELAEEVKTQQPDLLKQYEQIVKTSERKRELDRATNRIKTVQDRTVALGIQGEEYDIIRAFAEAGQFDKADKRLETLEDAKQTKPPEEPKESEDDRVERLAVAKAKEMLGDKLTQDTGAPSASGGLSGMDARTIKEKMSDPVWFKEHESEVDQLYKEGKFFNK